LACSVKFANLLQLTKVVIFALLVTLAIKVTLVYLNLLATLVILAQTPYSKAACLAAFFAASLAFFISKSDLTYSVAIVLATYCSLSVNSRFNPFTTFISRAFCNCLVNVSILLTNSLSVGFAIDE
jgi:hypothetical protein